MNSLFKQQFLIVIPQIIISVKKKVKWQVDQGPQLLSLFFFASQSFLTSKIMIEQKRIGILSSGGEFPGLNAVIHAILTCSTDREWKFTASPTE